jgi:acyl-[acyl-carrier-protein] desaturase
MEWTQTALLTELEPVVAKELDRHLATAQEWFPHEFIPWSEGRNYDGVLAGEPWSPEQSPVPDAARTALVVNLLTEDNLPSYHREIFNVFGRDGAWGTWVGRWTAEEGRHGTAIRDYLLVKRVVDPVALERERMSHMEIGFDSSFGADVLRSIAYVSMQELATRISHRNTGVVSQDPDCERLLAKVAADENLHMLFYRNVLGAALEIAPDETLTAVAAVVEGFQMPGSTLGGFARRSAQIAEAGIYDARIHHDQVLEPVLKVWRVFDRDNLSAPGEQAQEQMADYLAKLDKAASRFTERRAARAAKQADNGG